jgi:uncharacterized membrane protein YdjX (TVP38/TMEM64 family)
MREAARARAAVAQGKGAAGNMGLETYATKQGTGAPAARRESALTVMSGDGELAGMSSSPAKVPVGLLVKLGVAAVAALVLVALVLRGVDLRGLVNQAFDWIRSAGPWVFFGAVAVLPAFAFPITLFYLAAGPAFAAQMTLPGVIAATLVALAVNFALTFWLAHRALRPLVERLLAHTQFRVPQVSPENELTVAVLMRVTPGPPLFLQGYILGLSGVRFRTYMTVSMAVQSVMGTGVIVFGKALVEGKGGMAVMGVMLLVAAAVLVHVLRKRFAKRDAGQA